MHLIDEVYFTLTVCRAERDDLKLAPVLEIGSFFFFVINQRFTLTDCSSTCLSHI